MKRLVLALALLGPAAHGDEPAPQMSAEQLQAQVVELEAMVEDLKTQVRLRSAELLVARGRLRAAKRRSK